MAEVLDEGLDDWVTLGHVLFRASVLSDAKGTAYRPLALDALSVLLENHLVIAGNIGDSGFEAWDLSPAQALDRIRAECETKGWVLGLTDVWLATTAEGDALARSIGEKGTRVLNQLTRRRTSHNG